jgi:DNA-binding IclR family transcriptional regulator
VALHRVSTGKILLAACDDEAVEAYADRADLTARSPFGIYSPAALYRDIEQIRKAGFARSRGEVVEDIVGIATALKISGAVVGALCVVLPASRYDAARDADITRVLAAAAARFHP